MALVTGVPLGTFIGQTFGWQTSFLAVSLLGVIAVVGSWILVPNNIATSKPSSLLTQLSILKKPHLLLVYAMTTLGYGGTFIAFTYLAPILQEVSGFSASSVNLVMLVCGISVAVGNIWGGKLADREGPVRALRIVFALLALVLFVLTFTASNARLALATVLAWGAVTFGNVGGLQVYVVQRAQQDAPKAVDVASGLNIAAFNVGIAVSRLAGSKRRPDARYPGAPSGSASKLAAASASQLTSSGRTCRPNTVIALHLSSGGSEGRFRISSSAGTR